MPHTERTANMQFIHSMRCRLFGRFSFVSKVRGIERRARRANRLTRRLRARSRPQIFRLFFLTSPTPNIIIKCIFQRLDPPKGNRPSVEVRQIKERPRRTGTTEDFSFFQPQLRYQTPRCRFTGRLFIYIFIYIFFPLIDLLRDVNTPRKRV